MVPPPVQPATRNPGVVADTGLDARNVLRCHTICVICEKSMEERPDLARETFQVVLDLVQLSVGFTRTSSQLFII